MSGAAVTARQQGRVALAAMFVAAAAIGAFLSCSTRVNRERVELWGLGSEGEVVAQMIPEFERRNPGINVVVQQIPWSAAHEKLLTAHVGEATPDVAQMGNTWIPEFVAMNALADLGPLAAHSAVVTPSDYFRGIWATNVVDGTLYGIPWYVDTRVLFYRSDILASVGYPQAPRTWQQWRDAMQRIHEQHKSPWAILLPTNEWEPIVMLALSNGSALLNAEGTRGAFRQPAFAGAFDFYNDIFRSGFAPKVSSSQISNLYQQFAQGDFAMYITGPWNVGEFRHRLPAAMQDKWATAPLPARDASSTTGISMAGGSSLVVFQASRHRAAAEKLIEFLSEPAQQVRFFELTGDLPARRSAWSAPALQAESHFPAFREQLEHVEPLPRVPEWEQIASAIFDRGEAAARGAITTGAALTELDAKADELLEKRRWMLSSRRDAQLRVRYPERGHPAVESEIISADLRATTARCRTRSCASLHASLRHAQVGAVLR
ncbi:MAG TPA: sugar ABC transporter substrate-binding protein [Thermoanaerobaculia bacterium]|nr:sugar ABC transporter substrate-binding protein [Thermoanaerobaculia bacterium]